MARLRFETAPQITIHDEAAVFQASSNASAPLVEFRGTDGNVVANVSVTGVLNVASISVYNAANASTALATRRIC